ncbi:MAG: transcriptional regulator [Bdellovibrionales bacterium CG12_big_fil_rev_8_21_14_0_65_38_15]|nr:MAG: transcriptional regulator [Bdellovibrionales bacterium CG22_combo_CG10-13_8_21_14_all_38_13]PIQ57425.1 MAG: transcriptional regulator [Bdellovibrionales bacterium CG12_big_fil_rev_8_21_14_0_65_38_15]PIR31145.1 MAG: transcriptional regulator [Bdellovibrionales bacterium CG11_big_fil_rev_8_21_14_0_20_38_13]
MELKNHKLECETCVSHLKGIFCELSHDQLSPITNQKVTNIYKKGQSLFVEGNHPNGIFCISTGNIKLTEQGNDGKETLIRIVTKGDILGHRSLFSEQSYHATATAMEDTRACFIDKSFIIGLIKEQPSVALKVIEKLSKDMGAAEHRLNSMHTRNVRERLAELLLLLKESHGVDEGTRTKIDLRLTREEMSTMIGTAPETLIRFISEFKEAGLIEQEGKTIFVKDEGKLLEWTGCQL